MLKVLKRIVILFFIILILLFVLILVNRLVKATKYKIITKNGIQESTTVELGGIKQSIQIRGHDTQNPVIIFLHGGPASPMSYLSYYYQTELESDYTIVNWDQRGSGRTYFDNLNLNMKSDLSTAILINDLDQLIDYLRDRFKQEQVILMGHSWGTILGMEYIQLHPEKISAYIGVSQVVNFSEGLLLASSKALEKAKSEGNNKDIESITEEMNQYSQTENFDALDAKNYLNLVTYRQKYLASEKELSPLKQIWIGFSSPDLTLDDARWFLVLSNIENYFDLEEPLIDDLLFKFDLREKSKQYDVPVYFISGDNDWTTPKAMVEDYYQSIESSSKAMIIIENAGHAPFLDQPKDFCEAVKSLLLTNE